mgnify:CR=1 FL=1
MNYLIFFSILALAGSFFYFNDYKKKQVAPVGMSQQERDKVVDQVVNKYIKQATIEKSLNQIKIDQALAEARRKIVSDREAKRARDEKEMQKIQIISRIGTFIKQALCLHSRKEVREDNPKEKYIESYCIRCNKLIFKNS